MVVLQFGQRKGIVSLKVIWHCEQCRVSMDTRVTYLACSRGSVMLLGMLRRSEVKKLVVLAFCAYRICNSLYSRGRSLKFSIICCALCEEFVNSYRSAMSSMAFSSLRITYCCSSLSPMNVNNSGVWCRSSSVCVGCFLR